MHEVVSNRPSYFGTVNPVLTQESFLSNLGKRWGFWIASKTSTEKRQKVFATLESLGSTQLILPESQTQHYSKQFSQKTIDAASAELKAVIIEADIPSIELLGTQILDVDGFKAKLKTKLKEKRDKQSDLRVEILENLWLSELGKIPSDRGVVGNAMAPVWDRFGELASLTKPVLLLAGVSLRRINDDTIFSHFTRPLANKIVDGTTKLQLTMDIVNASNISGDEQENQQIVSIIGDKYGLDVESLSKLGHPAFFDRLTKSLALQQAIYTYPRLIGGYAVFGAMLESPSFHNFKMEDPLLAWIITTGILAGSMAARAVADYFILKKNNYSPDIIESTIGNMTGKINERKELVVEPRAALIGPILDVSVSSFMPPFNAAWVLGGPEYVIAMTADQWIFMATNLGWHFRDPLGIFVTKATKAIRGI